MANSSTLFEDDNKPWDMPTPRKQHSRADLIQNLLPASDVPESYIEIYDNVVREDGSGGKIGGKGVARTLAAAKLNADAHAQVMSIIAPAGVRDVALGRNEFNCLLALIGLTQEGETVSLDTIDERRASEWLYLFFISSIRNHSRTFIIIITIIVYLYLLSAFANGKVWMQLRSLYH